MTKNIDGFRYSAYMHKDRGGKLVVGPAWDWNLSFGNADYHDGSDPTGWYSSLLRESEICWFRRLSEDPDFVQRVIDRWSDLRRSIFTPRRSTVASTNSPPNSAKRRPGITAAGPSLAAA